MIRYLLSLLGIRRDYGSLAAGKPRSGKWPAVRDAWLREHGECAATGSKHDLEVHHKKPFQNAPDLELDPTNFVTLRRDMHLIIGHLDSWQSYNPEVMRDVARYRAQIESRP